MKILHVCDYFIENMGYQEKYLSIYQQKLGHDVTILTSDLVPDYAGKDNTVLGTVNEASRSVKDSVDSLKIIRKTTIEFQNHPLILGLYKELHNNEYDIIHLHTVFSYNSLISLRIGGGSTVFVDDHSHSFNFNVDTLSKRLFLLGVKKYLQKSDNKIAKYLPVSKAAYRILRDHVGIMPERMLLLPMGGTRSDIREIALNRKKFREQHDLNDDDFLIITTGKIAKNKEIDTLLRAFRHITESEVDVKLVIIGGGEKNYVDSLKSLSRNMGLEDRIIWIPFALPEVVREVLSACDAGIWPGDNTITAIDGLILGLPIIVPFHDDFYDNLAPYGILSRYIRGDYINLVSEIFKLFESRDSLNRTKNCRIKVSENELSWESIAERSIQIYEEHMNDQ